MRKIVVLLALAGLLAGCATNGAQWQTPACIPGDHGGPPACQQKTYLLAF